MHLIRLKKELAEMRINDKNLFKLVNKPHRKIFKAFGVSCPQQSYLKVPMTKYSLNYDYQQNIEIELSSKLHTLTVVLM